MRPVPSLLLVLALVTGCKPLDGPCWDDRVVFVDAAGVHTQVTGTFLAGTNTDPAQYLVDQDGTLEICAGSFFANVTVGGSATQVTITGPDGPGLTTLNGGGQAPVIDADATDLALVVNGLTLTGGTGAEAQLGTSSPTTGGGLRCVGPATATLTDLVVDANTAHRGGGIALVNECTGTISGVTISSNTTSGGGALYLSESEATVDDSLVSNNKSLNGGGGGGIALESSNLTLSSSTISENYSASSGAGIDLATSELELTDSLIHDNTAASNGAGLYLRTASFALLSNATLTENAAIGDGGAVYLRDSEVDIYSSTISDNLGSKGGGLYASASQVIMEDGELSANAAGTSGGGVHLEGESDGTFYATTFMYNDGGERGGALSLDESYADLVESHLEGNLTTDAGGGVFLEDSEATMHIVEVIANFSDVGAGVELSGSDLGVDNSWFEGNTATTAGGGISLELGSTLDVSESTLTNNDGGTLGGGLAVGADSLVWGEDCNVYDNAPDDVYKDGDGSHTLGSGVDFTF